VIILGTDPGFAYFGYALLEVGPESERVIAAGVIETKKSSKKTNTLAADDDTARTLEVAAVLSSLIETYRPILICSEAMSWPRNSSAARKVALAWGALIALAGDRQIPINQVSPQNLKQAVVGSPTAAKSEVEAAMLSRWPEIGGYLDKVKLAESKRNHAYDAAGAAYACLSSDLVRTLRNIQRQVKEI